MLKKIFNSKKVEVASASSKEVKEYIKALDRFNDAVDELDKVTAKMFEQNDVRMKRLQRIPF